MTPDSALRLAESVLRAADLPDWQVRVGNAKRQLGLCRYKDKRIVFARRLLESGDDALIKDVILHEVAHALAGPQAKHGPAWKRIAIAIGANPKSRTEAGSLAPAPAPWVGTCPACGATRELYRPPRRVVSCGACSKTFSPSRIFQWTHRGVPTAPQGAYAKELRLLS